MAATARRRTATCTAEAREIRTPNLVIWSHTRYRCAKALLEDTVRTPFPMFASKPVAKYTDLASP